MRRLNPPPRRPTHPITNRLRVLRAGRRWSQEEVAWRMGMKSKFRLWQIENGETQPTEKECRKLAKIFGCTITEIFPLGVSTAA